VALAAAVLLAVFVLPPEWRVAAVAAGGAIEVAESAFWFRWSRRRRAAVGVETLIGRVAVVAEPCDPRGQVRVAGELWRARCEDGADPGDEVRVLAVDELTLVVERL
jgi:membrane protein implicated in regulation of membrane protease activity